MDVKDNPGRCLVPVLSPGLLKKTHQFLFVWDSLLIIIIIIEGVSLLQSIPPTTADKQTQAQKRRGSRFRKLLGAKATDSLLGI